jgi:exo-1,4-beta-D-glucosaminidase
MPTVIAVLITSLLLLPFCRAQYTSSSSPIVSAAGDTSILSGWRLHSTKNLSASIEDLSQPGYDVFSWYHAPARGTVFAALIENGVYNETELFFSDNLLQIVDYSVFSDPWMYREEFTVNVRQGQHYFLQTHGITSRAAIHINGKLIADENTQVGAYGGLKYDITGAVQSGTNVILIKAYPTNYLRDFAMGFVDWNPYPPDNGTGFWRYIEIMQTGPVSISTPRVKTDFAYPWQSIVTITVKVDVANHDSQPINASILAEIRSSDGSHQLTTTQPVYLAPRERSTVPITLILHDPQIWWPATWGSQPLYTVNTTISTSPANTPSSSSSTRFGIRSLTTTLNAHNDTQFLINSSPFLVLGAGYTSDIFYRFKPTHLRKQLQLVLDMGLNTIRLEGKQEHPELYDLADEMGIMVLAGWECCDKWEGWTYNDEAVGEKWSSEDYGVAEKAMRHEAEMMQAHPCILGFLVGSDFWPDERATALYVGALEEMDWPNPIVASAAKRGYPELLAPGGMKMEGPYDWVPPNYWYRHGGELGAAGGCGSELGAGVGTPELSSLRKFLSVEDMDDLWMNPYKGLYHMSTNVSSFYDRRIYNDGLFGRYGNVSSLIEYLWKAQVMDYEATRAQVEANAVRKVAARPATGMVYWMLSGAWPNLHWQLFDYYLAGAGAYYGVKVGARMEHVVWDYEGKEVWVVSQALDTSGMRNVSMQLIGLDGTLMGQKSVVQEGAPNTATSVGEVPGWENVTDVAFLKLVLRDGEGEELSRNVYWLSKEDDVLDWENSDWYFTPVAEYANLTTLFGMQNASVTASVGGVDDAGEGSRKMTVILENTGEVPAFFVRLSLVSGNGGEKQDLVPVMFDDNYVTLFAGEKVEYGVRWKGQSERLTVEVSGVNVAMQEVRVGG